jgi:hypothetical protein
MASRRTLITSGFLTVTTIAVGWELVAANDHDPDTRPWTDLIASYIPAPVTFAAIAVLCSWLGPHFAHAYLTRKKTMAADLPVTPPMDSPTEPLLPVAAITAGVSALLALGASFGLNLTDTQTGAITTAVVVLAPVVVALVGRRLVWAPATVARKVAATRRGNTLPRPESF